MKLIGRTTKRCLWQEAFDWYKSRGISPLEDDHSLLITGPEADARRARALLLIGQDPTRVPDLLFSGPEVSVASDSRARFFGEDQTAASA
jgi:hypothetical protein